MAQKRSGLGKGLDALFLDNTTQDAAVSMLKISAIEPNLNQPRTHFEEASLLELADSIREHGVIQPLVVRSLDGGGYQIVAGERRWRASRIAGLSEVPVVIRELDDSQTLEIAIIENLQREDLNPIELAAGYKTLMEEYGLTQEQVADKLGKSRPVIANTIRLLGLPATVQSHVRSGAISQGHAKAMLALPTPELMEEVAEKVLRGQLLVRDIERIAQENKYQTAATGPKERDSGAWGAAYHQEVALALSSELGRKVEIKRSGKKFTLMIEYYSQQELDDLAARLGKSAD